MKIYLANAKQNYATEGLGFVMAQRVVGFPLSLSTASSSAKES